MAILHGTKARFETYHGVQISDDILAAALQLATRYFPDRFLPEKVMDLLDEAGSRVRTRWELENPILHERFMAIRQAQKQKEAALDADQIEEAWAAYRHEVALTEELDALHAEQARSAEPLHVTPQDLAEVITLWTGEGVEPDAPV